jgi:hypothetical protein
MKPGEEGRIMYVDGLFSWRIQYTFAELIVETSISAGEKGSVCLVTGQYHVVKAPFAWNLFAKF